MPTRSLLYAVASPFSHLLKFIGSRSPGHVARFNQHRGWILRSEEEIQFAMSMLDSFFNKSFRGAKCKTLLKLTIPRIKLLRNRRELQLKQMRKDIAKLLENGQEATARIRVEHIFREENMMAAQEILELFCELIAVRLPIIEIQRECPIDLKEAISTICFAAPRCADLPELLQIQMLFSAKYGKEFVAAAAELLPDCGVNRQVIELLSIRPPSVETKLKLLKEIAEEHELNWDPSATEMEFTKKHDDLLNGPSHFTNGATVPLPPPKHVEPSPMPVDETLVESDSDADGSLDLPDVPKDLIRAAAEFPSSRNLSNTKSSTDDLGHDAADITKPTHDDTPQVPSVEPEANLASVENKQFVPFVSPPSFVAVSASEKKNELPPTVYSVSDNLKSSQPTISPQLSSVSQFPNHNEPGGSSVPLSSFTELGDQNEPVSSHPILSTDAPFTKQTSASFPLNQNELTASFSQPKDDINEDLKDLLAAAQSAAETAERAAKAARAAADLAQIKITDHTTKTSTKDSCGNEHESGAEHSNNLPKQVLVQQGSFGSPTQTPQEMPYPFHVPQRLSSLEDDPYFSYPNLFTSKDSDLKSGSS